MEFGTSLLEHLAAELIEIQPGFWVMLVTLRSTLENSFFCLTRVSGYEQLFLLIAQMS